MHRGKKDNRQQRLLRHRSASLVEVIHHASFPIYGLNDQAPEFTVRTFSTRGFPEEPTSIGFVFANSAPTETVHTLSLESSDPHEANMLYPSPHEAVTTKFNLHHRLFQRYHLNNELSQFVDQFSRWQGSISISGKMFSGEIYYWLQPCQLALFLFEGKDTRLMGDARSLSLDQLLMHLQQLVPLNEREDLLTRYQREFNENEYN